MENSQNKSKKIVKKLANWDKNGIHNLTLGRICSIINFSRVKKGE